MLITKYYYGSTSNPAEVEMYHPIFGFEKLGKITLPRVTVCGIFDNETKVLKIGYSRCSPKDIFIKKIGKELAYNRAKSNPVITMILSDNEVLSHVFFAQAKQLETRVINMKHFKF